MSNNLVFCIYIRLYECLCDTRASQCVLDLDLYGVKCLTGLCQNFLVLSNMSKTQVPDQVPVTELFLPAFLCDVTYISLGYVNCRRQKINKDVCDTEPPVCMSYSVDLNASVCTTSCVSFNWFVGKIEDGFSYYINYINFDGLPTPVEDTVCPKDGEHQANKVPFDVSNTTSALNVSIHINIDNARRPNKTDSGGLEDAGLEQSADSRKTENEHSSVPIGAIAGSVVGGVTLILAGVVFVSFRVAMNRKRTRTSTSDANGDIRVYTLEVSPADIVLTGDITEESEAVRYYTLDEVSDTADEASSLDQCDDEGYSNVLDFAADNVCLVADRVNRKSRPLPQPPDHSCTASGTRPKSSPARQATSTAISEIPVITRSATSAMRKNAIASSMATGVKQSPDMPGSMPKIRLDGQADGLSPNICPQPLYLHTNPRPHRLQADQRQKDPVAVGNVRPHPHNTRLFGHVTEVKLVRNQEGHLELLSVEDELAAFTEYYTRLLIIKQEEGSLGILGLLEQRPADVSRENGIGELYEKSPSDNNSGHLDTVELLDDSPSNCNRQQQQGAPRESGGHMTRNSELSIPKGHSLQPVQSAPHSGGSRYHDIDGNPYTYVGTLELDEDAELYPCEYTTVLDDDFTFSSSSTEGYLRVLDMEAIDRPFSSDV